MLANWRTAGTPAGLPPVRTVRPRWPAARTADGWFLLPDGSHLRVPISGFSFWVLFRRYHIQPHSLRVGGRVYSPRGKRQGGNILGLAGAVLSGNPQANSQPRGAKSSVPCRSDDDGIFMTKIETQCPLLSTRVHFVLDFAQNKVYL